MGVPAVPPADPVRALTILPGGFEPNAGQYADGIRFLARHPDGAYVIHADGPEAVWGEGRVRLRFAGIGPHRQAPQGSEQWQGRVNYLVGKDSAQWLRDLPLYGRVEQNELYPGVAIGYRVQGEALAFDFALDAGVSPEIIAIAVEPPGPVEVGPDGGLFLERAGRHLGIQAPRAFQDVPSGRREFAAHYRLDQQGRIRLHVAGYDDARPLLIDPVLEFSSYLGGSDRDEGFAVTADAAGDLFIAGYTQSTDFPFSRPYAGQPSGFTGAYVAKFVWQGEGFDLAYATYVGDSVTEVRSLAVDGEGNAYVTGSTASTAFPTVNPLQAHNAGLIDGYVFKLNPNGDRLLYSTYFGGNSVDRGRALAVDGAGSVYVTGVTASTDFPLHDAWQSASGGTLDAFVLRLAPDGGSLVYSTFLGGGAFDYGAGIAVGADGAAYVTGNSESTNFPIVNPTQTANGGLADAVLAILDAAGDVLLSTYLGGSGNDYGNAVGIDADGHVYVAGQTASPDFPLQPAASASLSGGTDAFIAHFDPQLPALVRSRYFGGTGADTAYALVPDAGRRVHLAGSTLSVDLALVQPLQLLPGGGTDVFLATLDMQSGATLFSTYLGGTGNDTATALAAGPAARLYVTGRTDSPDLPLAAPLQGDAHGGGDAFVMSVGLDADGDTVEDYLDNCPDRPNTGQDDRDGDGTGDACEPPRVTGVWPAEAASLAFIFVFGGYFHAGSPPTVAFNGLPSPAVQVVSDDMLIAMLPAGDVQGPVVVTNELGSAAAPDPFGGGASGLRITGAWPGAGMAAGSFVFVFGGGFGPDTSVSIGPTPAPLVQVVTSEMLIFMMPAGAEAGPIAVQSGGAAVVTDFDYRVLP